MDLVPNNISIDIMYDSVGTYNQIPDYALCYVDYMYNIRSTLRVYRLVLVVLV